MTFRIIFALIVAVVIGFGTYGMRAKTVVMLPDGDNGKAEAPTKPLASDRMEPAALPAPATQSESAKKAAREPSKSVAPMPVLPLPAPKQPPVSLPKESSEKTLPETPIVMSSIVVVKCSFENAATGGTITAFGSGAIVDSRGYVLTARHVVDMEYAYRRTGGRQGASGYSLKSCIVGGPDLDAHAPTPQEIRALNPFTLVNALPYRATVAFVPNSAGKPGMSAGEGDFLDMAILKIIDVTDDAREFFGRSMPSSFPASRIEEVAFPAPGGELLTFGFPSGTPAYGNSFYLQGSVGAVRKYVGGDALFKDEPIGILADMETIGGRSGSPIFWKGRVIGVVSAKEDGSVRATIISTYPLKKMLEGSGITLSGL